MQLQSSLRTFLTNTTIGFVAAGIGGAFVQSIKSAEQLKPGEWS